MCDTKLARLTAVLNQLKQKKTVVAADHVEDYIEEYFAELVRQIDLKREHKLLDIHRSSAVLIDQIKEHRAGVLCAYSAVCHRSDGDRLEELDLLLDNIRRDIATNQSGQLFRQVGVLTSSLEAILLGRRAIKLSSDLAAKTSELCQIETVKANLYETNCFVTKEKITAMSYDGNNLLACNSGHDLLIWDISTKKCINILKIGEAVCGVGFIGERFIVSFSPLLLRLWDVSTGDCVHEYYENLMQVVRIACQDSLLFVHVIFGPYMNHPKPQIQIFEIVDQQPNLILKKTIYTSATCMAVQKTSTEYTLAVGLWTGVVDIYNQDAPPNNCNTSLIYHTQTKPFLSDGECCAVAFAGLNTLACGYDGGTLRIWDVLSGLCVRVLNDHHIGDNFILAYDGERSRIASASKKEIKVCGGEGTDMVFFSDQMQEFCGENTITPQGPPLAMFFCNKNRHLAVCWEAANIWLFAIE